MRKLFLFTVFSLFIFFSHLNADITGLGDLPGGGFGSHANAVSANGSVVVGESDSGRTTNQPKEAFRWTQSEGMVGLGDLPGDEFRSAASGVSDDGSVIVGTGESTAGWDGEAFVWTEVSGMVGLGSLTEHSDGSAVSADGLVVAGSTWGGDNPPPYRWTETVGMVGLGDLPGGGYGHYVGGVSVDGSVVVGRSESANGPEAFRWTEASGMIGLGDLPGGSFISIARDVSADGSIVAGTGTPANGKEAFLWTETDGLVGLGDLPGGNFWSDAYGISADGSVVVGHSQTENGFEAFVWTQQAGMVRLADLLSAQGDDLSHWTNLKSAFGVSADGRTIVGLGINISGDSEAFLATLVGDVATVVPDSFSVTRGSYVSGGLMELTESDNADLSIRRATSDIQSRTEFEVKAVSPNATPSSLEVTLEGSVFARSQVNQTIELYDYVTGTWEQVDSRAATRFTDSTVSVSATGDLSRFVEAGTLCLKARIRYQSPAARQQFSSNTDQFTWTIGQ